MKNLLFLTILNLFFCLNAIGQVGIGTTSPNASSLLDVFATDKGILIPRLTTAARIAIISPPQSLMIYDTDVDLFY